MRTAAAEATTNSVEGYVEFVNNFWGSSPEQSFEIISIRIKDSIKTLYEVINFYQEKISIEKDYIKRLEKLQAKCPLGTHETGSLKRSLDKFHLENDTMIDHNVKFVKSTQDANLEKLQHFTQLYTQKVDKLRHHMSKVISRRANTLKELNVHKNKYQEECGLMKSLKLQLQTTWGKELEKNQIKYNKLSNSIAQTRNNYQYSINAFKEINDIYKRDWSISVNDFYKLEIERVQLIKINCFNYCNNIATLCVDVDQSIDLARSSFAAVQPQPDVQEFSNNYGTGNKIYNDPEYVEYMTGTEEPSIGYTILGLRNPNHDEILTRTYSNFSQRQQVGKQQLPPKNLQQPPRNGRDNGESIMFNPIDDFTLKAQAARPSTEKMIANGSSNTNTNTNTTTSNNNHSNGVGRGSPPKSPFYHHITSPLKDLPKVDLQFTNPLENEKNFDERNHFVTPTKNTIFETLPYKQRNAIPDLSPTKQINATMTTNATTPSNPTMTPIPIPLPISSPTQTAKTKPIEQHIPATRQTLSPPKNSHTPARKPPIDLLSHKTQSTSSSVPDNDVFSKDERLSNSGGTSSNYSSERNWASPRRREKQLQQMQEQITRRATNEFGRRSQNSRNDAIDQQLINAKTKVPIVNDFSIDFIAKALEDLNAGGNGDVNQFRRSIRSNGNGLNAGNHERNSERNYERGHERDRESIVTSTYSRRPKSDYIDDHNEVAQRYESISFRRPKSMVDIGGSDNGVNNVNESFANKRASPDVFTTKPQQYPYAQKQNRYYQTPNNSPLKSKTVELKNVKPTIKITPVNQRPYVSTATARYTFKPQEEGELYFRKGWQMFIIHKQEDNWFVCELGPNCDDCNGMIGLVPGNYIVEH